MSALSELLLAAGLTGRGGADFPTGAKLELGERHNAALIVNACDGELDAAKDGWVIAHHLAEVLDAAGRITAKPFTIAAHRDSETFAALRAAGVATLAVPPRYVSSEESALARLAHGGPARPIMRYRPIVVGGRDSTGRRLPPTLVLNAETVWRIEQIVEHGPRWFRSHGTPDEPGPRLVTVVGGVAAPGVYPAEAGVALQEILDRAGGLTTPMRALWISGLSGGFLRAVDARDSLWSRAGLAPFGIRPGAATVRVIGEEADPWHEVLNALRYAAGETAGQCGPCMFGLPALLTDLTAVLHEDSPADAAPRLARRIVRVAGRGACRYPDGVAGFLSSALDVFGAALPEVSPCH